MGIDLETFRSGLLPQLEHLNALLLDAVSENVSVSVEYAELPYKGWTADCSRYHRLVPYQTGG